MSTNPELVTQIAHVLFLDIVGWSRESIDAQGRLLAKLSDLVKECPTFASARGTGEMMAFPSGDGMWILFKKDLSGPARCAAELAVKLKDVHDLSVRMGIHSGPVRFQTDIAGTQTVVGDGINTAKRVMDMGDGGHIVMSSQYAVWLAQSDEWSDKVHPWGVGYTKHGEKLDLFVLACPEYGRTDPSSHLAPVPAVTSEPKGSATDGNKVVIVYKRGAQPDDSVLSSLEDGLRRDGNIVFVDRHLRIGVEWAKAIEQEIRTADFVVAIVSDSASGSEMLEYELQTAFDERSHRGHPSILPVRVGGSGPIEGPVGAQINGLNFAEWTSSEDTPKVLSLIRTAMGGKVNPELEEIKLEPVGGAVSPESPFYAERLSDIEFVKALEANESIILVKGPRQMGKTSLIGRGTKLAKEKNWRVASTDFQKLSTSQLGSDDSFYKLLAATLGRQLKFAYDFNEEWLDVFGANMNLDNFIRALIESQEAPLVWFMDEADKLFGSPFASDFFGLVRSWHNSRATEFDGPWKRFTVVIGYATEAHLFIQDLNQSPFNVGRSITLQPFNLDQVWDLNERYGSPIDSKQRAQQLFQLLGGQPYLTRMALDQLARNQMDFNQLMASANRDDGPFGDHLKRILISVMQLPEVLAALKVSLTSPEISQKAAGFQRLLSAGILRLDAVNKPTLACDLYRQYLSQHVS